MSELLVVATFDGIGGIVVTDKVVVNPREPMLARLYGLSSKRLWISSSLNAVSIAPV